MTSVREIDNVVESGSDCSSGSDSGSTCEEERLRELFVSCDQDGDGFIDSHDLLNMCERLNMLDAVTDLQQQLGMDEEGMISFQQFLRCRRKLMGEIEAVKCSPHRVISTGYHGGAVVNALERSDPVKASWHTSSENSLANSGMGYDSGAQDIGLEMPTIMQLMETHENSVYEKLMSDPSTARFVEIVNELHMKALSSMRADYLDVTGRVHRVTSERDQLEKQVAKLQAERLHHQRDHQLRLDQMSSRYEERITELHSVIAELQKKFERTNQFNVIREEDEFEETAEVGKASNLSELSATENNENTQSITLDLEPDVTAHFQRVVSDLEFSETESDLQKKELDRSPCTPPSLRSPCTPPPPPPRVASLKPTPSPAELRLKQLLKENENLKSCLGELERRVADQQLIRPADTAKSADGETQSQYAVAKVAGLKKLVTSSSPKKVRHHREHGSMETTVESVGLPSSKLAEHLSAEVHDSSSVQELLHALSSGGDPNLERVREIEVEMERLSSQIDHLKSQNDVLAITLDESKSYADRLTVLFAKYESNMLALQMSADYSDNLLEAYEVLTALTDSEISVLQARVEVSDHSLNRKDVKTFDNHSAQTAGLRSALESRLLTVARARTLIRTWDQPGRPDTASPASHEDMSVSYTLSTSASSSTLNSADLDYCRQDDDQIRLHIHTLKNERAVVKSTVMDLESVHLDSVIESGPNPDAHRLDLENAVLMQELMAMKEEKSELKSQNYVLTREKQALELRLNSRELQEQSYQVQICHLKSELKEMSRTCKELKAKRTGEKGVIASPDRPSAPASHSELRSQSPSQLIADLIETQRREEKLRRRVYDLVSTLEKLSRESELRHNQSAEFVNDLKKANCSLITSFERAKKRYQSKVKKLETQLQEQRDYYESRLQEQRKSQSSSGSGSEDHAPVWRINETSL